MTLKANSDDDFPDEDDDDNEWSDAEIIRVANCVDLEVSLTSNQGWPKDMGSKMMIFENIEELRMSTFDLGKANSDLVNKFISKGKFSAGYTRPNKILILVGCQCYQIATASWNLVTLTINFHPIQ